MIYGHAQLLGASVTDRDGAESLAAIQDAVETMQHVLGDLASVIDGGRRAWPVPVNGARDIDARHLLLRTVQSLPSAAARTRIDTWVRAIVCGDPVRVRQCLLNVLGNADKYAPTGEIIVSVRRDGGFGVIRIDDEGPGIPEPERRSAFIPLQRSSATRDLPGEGLGLYIASALMTSMGGLIELSDAPSGGLRVEL
ncbi:sensor histidine kinase, partial [Actinomadura adrarensis]